MQDPEASPTLPGVPTTATAQVPAVLPAATPTAIDPLKALSPLEALQLPAPGPTPEALPLAEQLFNLQSLPPELLAQRNLYINSVARDLLEIANSGRSETARISAAKELNLMFQVTSRRDQEAPPAAPQAPAIASKPSLIQQNNYNFPAPEAADPATAALLARFARAASSPTEALDSLTYTELEAR